MAQAQVKGPDAPKILRIGIKQGERLVEERLDIFVTRLHGTASSCALYPVSARFRPGAPDPDHIPSADVISSSVGTGLPR